MILGLSEVSDVSNREHLSHEPSPIEAPWYKGIGTGIVQGIEHAFDVAGASADDNFEHRAKEIRESRPDPVKVGAAGQILHGFSSIAAYGAIGAAGGALPGAAIGGAVGALPGAAAGALFGSKVGATASIGYLSGVDKYFEMIDQGVDHKTASQAAGITGTVMAIGAAAPAYIGKTLGRQVLSGAGMNVAFGMAERGATGALLKEDYSKIAEHYKALDGQGMVLDAMLGAAFPLGGKFLDRTFSQQELDAGMTKQQDIAAQTRNPGLESNLADVENTKAVLSEADKQLLSESRTVSTVDLPPPTATIPNPEFGVMMRNFEDAASIQLAKDAGVPIADVMEDINRAIKLDAEVRGLVQEKIDANKPIEPTVKESLTVEKPVDLTHESYARMEADTIAQAHPDVQVAEADGTVIDAANIGKHIDDITRKGAEDSFLHNVAISCFLTHGE
jgi:hypothetical protein